MEHRDLFFQPSTTSSIRIRLDFFTLCEYTFIFLPIWTYPRKVTHIRIYPFLEKIKFTWNYVRCLGLGIFRWILRLHVQRFAFPFTSDRFTIPSYFFVIELNFSFCIEEKNTIDCIRKLNSNAKPWVFLWNWTSFFFSPSRRREKFSQVICG